MNAWAKTARRAADVTAVAALVLAWVLLGPARLGGAATYLMVSGTSMLPGFRAGDLVVVRRAEHYGPGDVVAYRNRELGILVLHRILRLEDGRYVFKGDNNAWEDRYRPGQEDLVGKLWVRLPGMGVRLRQWRTPRSIGTVLGVVMMGIMIGEVREQMEARRRLLRGRTGGIRPGRPVLVRGAAAGAVVFAALMALCGALAFVAFGRPLTQMAASPVPYTQEGTFTYSASAEPGPVYDDGSVDPGDAVFSRLVPRLDVGFDYQFASRAPHAVRGTGALRAVVAGASGWRHTLTLQPDRPFEGDRLSLRGTLDLAAVASLVTRFLQATGLQTDQLSVALVADVRVAGELAGQGLTETFAPALDFQLTPLVMNLKRTGLPTEQDPLRPVKTGTIQAPVAVPNRLRLLRLAVDVETARRIAAVGLGTTAVGLVACLVLVAREQRQGEAVRIRARYGAFIIDAEAVGAGETPKMVRVTNMESLAKLAVQYERLILHEWREGQHWYVVHTPEAAYCYRAGGAAAGRVEDPQPA